MLGETPDDHRFIVTEPGRGYRFVAKVGVATAEPQASIAQPAIAQPAIARKPYLTHALLGVLGLAIAILVAVVYQLRRAPERPTDARFEIEATKTLNPLSIALSPDGRQIAYVGESQFGSAIWIRALNSLEARVLPGTEGVCQRARIPSGHPMAITSGFGRRRSSSASRSPGVSRRRSRARSRVFGAPIGGQAARCSMRPTRSIALRRPEERPSSFTQLDAALGEIAHSAPWFLPDGRHFLYKVYTVNRRNGAIYIGSLDPSEPRKHLLDASRAIYVDPGYILYTREQMLFARPFDPERREFTGNAVAIVDDVYYRENLDTSAFDAANNGTLIFRRVPAVPPEVPLVWTDLTGNVTTRAGFSLAPVDFSLSPDGKRIVFAQGSYNPDIWIYDIERSVRMRLTASDFEVDHNAIWSPDGASIAFDSHRQGGRAIYEKRADGATPERLLLDAGAHDVRVTDWSADGRFIVFEQDSCVGCAYDIWVLPTTGSDAPFAYASSSFDERAAALSPDARWIAYSTNESGVYQVVVQAFPDASQGRWQISASGGYAPRWVRDGRKLFYHDLAGWIVRVPIVTDPAFEVGDAEAVAQAWGPYQ